MCDLEKVNDLEDRHEVNLRSNINFELERSNLAHVLALWPLVIVQNFIQIGQAV